MSFNIKPILEEVRFTRPKNLFEYILYYPVPSFGNDYIVMYPIFNLLYMNNDVKTKLISYDWFVFITTLTTDFPLPLNDSYNTYAESNIINDYIFDNYSSYEFLPKITRLFTYEHFTVQDRNYMRGFINGIVANVLLKNAEKYEKLYDAMTLEFNPLWNVDGTTTTVRTLERDGTETTAKSGSDTNTREFLNKDKITYDTDVTTGYNSDIEHKYQSDERTDYNSTDTRSPLTTETHTYNNVANTKTGTEARTIDKGVSAYNSNNMTPKESTTDDLQYEQVKDTKTGNETIGMTGTDTNRKTGYDNESRRGTDTDSHTGSDNVATNGTETTDHSGKIKDTLQKGSTDTLTLDTLDTERTEVTRTGNIGVTSSTQLLTELVDFANYVDLVKEISHDIVSELCYLV